MAHELVAEVWRGEFLESEHHGSVIALDRTGREVLTVGRPHDTTYPRSSNKPVQALAMLRHGLGLDDELLALACASHSGEDFHIDGVHRILDAHGLDETQLQCTPDLPIGEDALQAHLTAGRTKAAKYMNCSGKHAAMLATCVVNGWSTHDYLDPTHPLQNAIRDTLEELAGERIGAEGVDGCGAPLFGISLKGLAGAFSALARAADGPERRIARAMNRYPEWVGGTNRDVTKLMRAIPGAVAKDGAEGVYAIGLPTGEAVACKIADGSSRARAVVLVAALRKLGIGAPDELATFPVLGHGRAVGAIKPSPALVG